MPATLQPRSRCYAGENPRTDVVRNRIRIRKNMSFRAPLQCALPLTFLLLGLGTSSASAAETQAVRPFELAQAPDQTPPSANKEKPDEPAKKHLQQNKANAQKQQ